MSGQGAKKEEEESYLLLTTVQGEKVRAAQKEIMYMEAFAHTVQIHTKEEILEVRCGINTLEEQLEGKNFIRCHRSYIVGLAYAARIKKKELLLDDGTSVPVSRRLFQEVNRAFVAYYRREERGKDLRIMSIWLAVVYITAFLLAAVGLSFLIRWYLTRLVDRRIEGFQNDLISRQVDEVENMYRQMRGWRHDFRNHIQTMLILMENGENQRLKEYLEGLNADLTEVDQVLKTGNVMADAILNSKLSLARAKGIAVNAKAKVPDRMRISDVNLCAMLGNLLDNAIEACLRIEEPEKRFIRVYIGIMKQQLYISVTNSMGKRPEKTGGRFLSSKSGRDEMARFGFGLMRIDVIAEQNGGYVNRQNEEGVFATEVMLPL